MNYIYHLTSRHAVPFHTCSESQVSGTKIHFPVREEESNTKTSSMKTVLFLKFFIIHSITFSTWISWMRNITLVVLFEEDSSCSSTSNYLQKVFFINLGKNNCQWYYKSKINTDVHLLLYWCTLKLKNWDVALLDIPCRRDFLRCC